MNALHELQLVRPSSVDDAVRALAEDGARPLAGGTDLLPTLRRGLGPASSSANRRMMSISPAP